MGIYRTKEEIEELKKNRPLCKCGCGNPVNWQKKHHKWGTYLRGHNSRIWTEEMKEVASKRSKSWWTEERKKEQSERTKVWYKSLSESDKKLLIEKRVSNKRKR